MVVYTLWMQADLEGVARMELQPNADLCVTVRNPVNHEQVREKIVIDTTALEKVLSQTNNDHPTNHHHPKKHAEAPCHFALKWTPDTTERATIRVWNAQNAAELFAKHSSSKHKKQQQSTTTLISEYTAADSGKRVALLALECQGHIEPVAWHLMGKEFVVTTTAGQIHSQLDWNDDDTWTAYDLASGSTTIANVRAVFE